MMEKDAALVLAAEDGQTEAVRALLDAGANVHAVDDLALWLAAKNGHTETGQGSARRRGQMSTQTRMRRCGWRQGADTPRR